MSEKVCYEHKRKHHTSGCTACWVCEVCGAQGCSNNDFGQKRNGETKPPTKPGYYWATGVLYSFLFQGQPQDLGVDGVVSVDETGIIRTHLGNVISTKESPCTSLRWWGPVHAPWEKRTESPFR